MSFPCRDRNCSREFGSEHARDQHQSATHAKQRSCNQCNRCFSTDQGLAAHTLAVHPPTYACSVCSKEFRTQDGMESHSRASHPLTFECRYCNKVLRSEHAQMQHERDSHEVEEDSSSHSSEEDSNSRSSEWRPNAPLSSPGYWIARDQFRGKKSFGYFECDGCSKSWMSAHAFPIFTQGCQSCEEESLPTWLWVNIGEREEPREDKNDEKPHDQDRCEACRAGKCLKRS